MIILFINNIVCLGFTFSICAVISGVSTKLVPSLFLTIMLISVILKNNKTKTKSKIMKKRKEEKERKEYYYTCVSNPIF